MRELAGKTAFVTGAGAGIGLALTKALLGAGMNVVASDLSRPHLDEAAAELEPFAGSLRLVELDVTDRAAWAAAAEEAVRAFGAVHLLCNNAGVNVIRDIGDATFEDFDWLTSVNYGGTVNGVLTLLPHMRSHGEGGHIVNVSSIAGIRAGPATAAYAATKFAIRGLSEAMRHDVARHGIAVSVVCPGTVSTRLFESEQHRQARFRGTLDESAEQVRRRGGELFRRILPMGMAPGVLAERVLRGIRADAFYIFPHVEVKQDVFDSFEEMRAAFTDDAPDPQLERLEESRRRHERDTL